VLLLVLPLGQVYNAIMYVRNKYVFWTKSAPKKHDERVRRLQEQIRARDPNAPMCTGALRSPSCCLPLTSFTIRSHMCHHVCSPPELADDLHLPPFVQEELLPRRPQRFRRHP
jgi:hypothetical protein